MVEGSTTGINSEQCPCCGGMRYQYNRQTGINEPCRCCGGTGNKNPVPSITMGASNTPGIGDKEIRG